MSIHSTHELTLPINSNSLEQLPTYFRNYHRIHYSVLLNVISTVTDGVQQGVYI